MSTTHSLLNRSLTRSIINTAPSTGVPPPAAATAKVIGPFSRERRCSLAQRSSGRFALRQQPPQPVDLRVTEWERALRTPALVWLKRFLGVEADDENNDAWRAATGQWVHRWLAQAASSQIAQAFVPVPPEETFRRRI